MARNDSAHAKQGGGDGGPVTERLVLSEDDVSRSAAIPTSITLS